MLRVAALSTGLRAPSARFRIRQYGAPLLAQGISLREFIAPLGAYPPRSRWIRPLWGVAALLTNVPRVVRSWDSDVCLLQRSLISTVGTIEWFTRRPRVLDVDDAIFLHRGGRTARKLASQCDAVLCGNAYLAEWFARYNDHTSIIPTAVDTDKYIPRRDGGGRATVNIGWIGTSGNLRYLTAIEPALSRVLADSSRTRLRVVSDRAPMLKTVPADRLEFVRWTEEEEIAQIQQMDIGIMPLDDSPWSRGKCSFKMLQYMACGLPVVVSPFGMNAEVLSLDACGMAAVTEREWTDALATLVENQALRDRMGAVGRRIVLSHFSISAIAPKLARCLLDVV